MQQVPAAVTITADVLQIEEPSLVKFACDQAGEISGEAADIDDVLFNLNSVPCTTFSIAARSGLNRKFKGSVHGCNFRQRDEFRSPCCPPEAKCKYAAVAREHDDIVKRVKSGLEHDKRLGHQYDFGIENPKGELIHRDYMHEESWNTPMSIKLSDCCAYCYELRCKKPMMLATSMIDYQPEGTTGNGMCNRGMCGMRTANGHEGKLGRLPKDGPRGKGAMKAKNSLPPMWIEEILTAAMARAAAQGRSPRTVVDICSGWQSAKAVCSKLGLRYIALDAQGDRNLPRSKRTSVKSKSGVPIKN